MDRDAQDPRAAEKRYTSLLNRLRNLALITLGVLLVFNLTVGAFVMLNYFSAQSQIHQNQVQATANAKLGAENHRILTDVESVTNPGAQARQQATTQAYINQLTANLQKAINDATAQAATVLQGGQNQLLTQLTQIQNQLTQLQHAQTQAQSR